MYTVGICSLVIVVNLDTLVLCLVNHVTSLVSNFNLPHIGIAGKKINVKCFNVYRLVRRNIHCKAEILLSLTCALFRNFRIYHTVGSIGGRSSLVCSSTLCNVISNVEV